MKPIHIRKCVSTLLVSLLGVLSGALTGALAGEPQKGASEAAGYQQVFDRHKEALQDAAQRKSSTVTLDLDVNGKISAGDLVLVNYAASLEDGTLLGTTLEKAANDRARKKAAWFKTPERFLPVELIAGKEELFPGSAGALLGMGAEEKKHLVIPPEKGFGPYEERKKSVYPTTRTIPRVIRMGADEYIKKLKSFPVVGKEVELVTYFKARVTHVGENEATLEFLPKDGARFEEEIGVIEVRVKGDEITTTLQPKIGADFMGNGMQGKIVAVESGSFTVDYNDPLAGKPIILDLEVVNVTKAAALQTKPIDWIEEHDDGLARAKREGKPVFLILYADWCGWCKKTFAEIIQDPRVNRLKDKFVWIKVNADKKTKYKQIYGQNGFPMMVLLRPDGTVAEKIDGFRDGATLARVLKEFLATSQPGQAGTKTVSATDGHR